MSAHWPQWLTLFWLPLPIIGHAYGAGKKETTYEGWIHFVVGIIRCAAPTAVLYAGGFFAPLGWGAP